MPSNSMERQGSLSIGPTRSVLHRFRWWGIALAGTVCFGAGGYYAWQQVSSKSAKEADPHVSALTVTVARAENGIIPRSLMVTGSLAARDELPIGTETSELALSEVLVDVGDHVKQGQLLARFNDKVLRAQLQQAEASLREAEANVFEANANARRADELAKTGWMSGKDHDNRRATALTMEARVGVARANLALAEAKLRQAELRAPADGTITLRNAHLGAVVSAGNGELFRMIRDDRIELVAELPETDLAAVRVGQAVVLTIDGVTSPSGGTPGVVRLIEPTVDVKTRIGRVRVDVGKESGLLPGMFATGRVSLGQTEALVVPEKVIVYQDGKPVVFVIDATGKADPRPIVLGARDRGRIEVSAGLQPGERLALLGAGHLKSGDHVTIVDTPAEQASGSTPRSY
ncbi:efflux RND transporter periplasmic adaptor subunit [Telmatospirillum sp.]|uniref:efflux RND transporter periplasmic adaptor subunit n=1 Tax=Telmatospirillum sp. TaxID=2079197 RepID=UPI00284D3D4D|nr:efflux RND transporter periplasmic adaptor subunit [Telmatospirillum sp.]MDR3435828.1 efflux RND transporter periplasmic adaptor subunit [Telmatospirillum sp.]